jgi:IclR family transcriptional regulator, KDG regulon repressor
LTYVSHDDSVWSHRMEPKFASRESRHVASVVKALKLLELIGTHGPLTLSEVSQAAGMPKSTLFRLLTTLTDTGFIRRRGPGEYVASMKLWRIGASAVQLASLREDIVGALARLVSESNETAHYSVYEDGFAVYVDKAESPQPVHAYTAVGGRSPAYASATGKVLLAHASPEERTRVASLIEPHTPQTVSNEDDLERELEKVRHLGFAVNRGEWRTDVWGVAAPVFGLSGDADGAVGVSGPRSRVEPRVPDFCELVCDVARDLSERRGWIGAPRQDEVGGDFAG